MSILHSITNKVPWLFSTCCAGKPNTSQTGTPLRFKAREARAIQVKESIDHFAHISDAWTLTF